MSVIGIDFGNQSCYVGTARAGGIELVLNDYSNRDTPSYVAFMERNRVLGTAARNNSVGNVPATVFNFKRLLGRSFKDPFVQEELKYLPFNVHETAGGGIGIKVTYLEKEVVFSSEQITAMLLGKLKSISEIALKTAVTDCVISVPIYYTDMERRALLAAAQIAGLNVLRLMNDPTAVALAYGLYCQDLPEGDQPPRNIVFVDVGYTTTQLALVAYNKGKLKVLGTVVDPNLGGRNLDYALVQHFAEEFRQKYNMDVFGNKRALMRLRDECEKMKKMMSSIANDIPMNIECFMNDKDVSGKMKREHFEELVAPELQRFEQMLQELLQTQKISPEDVHKVEIVGGGVRVPAIKNLIKKVLHVEPSTSLNQDEAVARGCTIQCAILSPALKVKDFSIADVCPYAIELTWPADKVPSGHLEIFPKNHASPYSKMVTFSRSEPFYLEAVYGPHQHIPHSSQHIGKFHILDVKPAPGETTTKVRIKTRVGLSGLFGLTNAYREEIVLVEEDAASVQVQPMPAMETDEGKEGSNDASPDKPENSKMDVDSEETKDVDKPKKTKKQSKQIELRIEAEYPEFPPQKIQEFIEAENEMRSQDKAEKEKADVKNALEEYIYDIRSKITGDYNDFVTDNDRGKLSNMLQNAEDWLYSDGENQAKSQYAERLDELKKLGNPIAARYREAQDRPALFEDMSRFMQLTRKAVDSYRAGDEKLKHLDSKDIDKVVKAVDEKQRWLDEKMNAQSKRPLYEEPTTSIVQIKKEKEALEFLVNPILSKPKPAAPKPPPPTADSLKKDKDEGGKNGQQTANGEEFCADAEMDTQ